MWCYIFYPFFRLRSPTSKSVLIGNIGENAKWIPHTLIKKISKTCQMVSDIVFDPMWTIYWQNLTLLCNHDNNNVNQFNILILNVYTSIVSQNLSSWSQKIPQMPTSYDTRTLWYQLLSKIVLNNTTSQKIGLQVSNQERHMQRYVIHLVWATSIVKRRISWGHFHSSGTSRCHDFCVN